MKTILSENKLNSLESKVIIITGASSGIGKNLAFALVKYKPKLVLVARRKKKLMQVVKTLEKKKIKVLPIIGDVRDREVREQITNLSLQVFGRIDYLINNAGLGKADLFVEQSESDIDEMIETNLLSLIKLTKNIVPIMKDQNSGRIINMSSTLALLPVFPFSVYCATKSAVKTFSDALRFEVQKYGIKVSTVLPGPYDTEFNDVAGISGEKTLCFKVDSLINKMERLLLKPKNNLIQPWYFKLLIWLSQNFGFIRNRALSSIAYSIYNAKQENQIQNSFKRLKEKEIEIKTRSQ